MDFTTKNITLRPTVLVVPIGLTVQSLLVVDTSGMMYTPWQVSMAVSSWEVMIEYVPRLNLFTHTYKHS